jgi:hypothetical protein
LAFEIISLLVDDNKILVLINPDYEFITSNLINITFGYLSNSVIKIITYIFVNYSYNIFDIIFYVLKK